MAVRCQSSEHVAPSFLKETVDVVLVVPIMRTTSGAWPAKKSLEIKELSWLRS